MKVRYVFRLETAEGIGAFCAWCPIEFNLDWDTHPTPTKDGITNFTFRDICGVISKKQLFHWFKPDVLWDIFSYKGDDTYEDYDEEKGEIDIEFRPFFVGVYKTAHYKVGGTQLAFEKEKSKFIERIPLDNLDRIDYYETMNPA